MGELVQTLDLFFAGRRNVLVQSFIERRNRGRQGPGTSEQRMDDRLKPVD
jgi:hypothetical protein